LACKDYQGQWDLVESEDQQESRARMGSLELRARGDRQVLTETLERWATQAQQDHVELKVKKESVVQQESWDQLDHQGLLGSLQDSTWQQ